MNRRQAEKERKRAEENIQRQRSRSRGGSSAVKMLQRRQQGGKAFNQFQKTYIAQPFWRRKLERDAAVLISEMKNARNVSEYSIAEGKFAKLQRDVFKADKAKEKPTEYYWDDNTSEFWKFFQPPPPPPSSGLAT